MSDKKAKHYLTCTDFSVSNEKFELLYHEDLDLLQTTPAPSLKDLPQYYKSENYISHTNSNKSLFDKVYQVVRNYTLKKKVSLINSFDLDKKSLLDVGCGTGHFLNAAKNNGWKVSGMEPDDDARAIADTILDEKIFSNIDQLNEEKFDCITLWHVLEHVPNVEDYIQKLEALLKPNGRLLIAVPNFKSYDANFYKEHWAAFDVPRHLWHFSQTAIKKLFGARNFKIERTAPMKFDAFYVSLLSEQYKKNKLGVFRAFIIGCLSNLKAKRTSEYSSLIYVLKKNS